MDQKRGWIFDQLMIVGQLEAAMNHNDEEICNIHQDMENNPDDLEMLNKKAEELRANYEIIQVDYQSRVAALNEIFDTVPNSNRHYYCQMKHRAALYVMAAENFHARGTGEAEQTLIEAGRSLAMTCSLAFGFEPMQCLRCLDEAVKAKVNEVGNPVEVEPIPEKKDIEPTL